MTASIAESSRRLSVLVPTTGEERLGEKLRDLQKLEPWLAEIVVCFNGPEAEVAAVAAVVDTTPTACPCILVDSKPFSKAAAFREGLTRATSERVLYTDADCLIHGKPGDLLSVLDSDDVSSFLVLRRPTGSKLEVRAKLARRQTLASLYERLGLLYLSARGGGYVAGNLDGVLDERALSDDLLFPAEWAAQTGAQIVPSGALVFYEARSKDSRRYLDKLPRLIYGSFQAARLAHSRRVRASIAVQKLAKYVVVAATPFVVVGGLAVMRLPLWPGAILLLCTRLFLRTWEGFVRGIWDLPPRW